MATGMAPGSVIVAVLSPMSRTPIRRSWNGRGFGQRRLSGMSAPKNDNQRSLRLEWLSSAFFCFISSLNFSGRLVL